MCVVITGSTKGIGRGLAEAFAALGHQVMISGRTIESVEAAHKSFPKELWSKVNGMACDVSDAEQVQDLWNLAVGTHGKVDIWINNAGLARTGFKILDVPQGDVETMVCTNMFGTINGARVAARGMLEQGHGKIFNMLGGGSDGEYFPGMGIYGTTKRGLNYFTDALVKELSDSPLVIGKIRPGMVITEAVVREAKDDPETFEKSRKIMNNMVDQVETVCPWLANQIVACEKSGTKIRWLNPWKMTGRMLKGMISKRPDQFERHGL